MFERLPRPHLIKLEQNALERSARFVLILIPFNLTMVLYRGDRGGRVTRVSGMTVVTGVSGMTGMTGVTGLTKGDQG